METSQFASLLESLADAPETRRDTLRRLGVSGLAAGLLTAAGAASGRAQTWDSENPMPPDAPPPIAGVSGGMPPFVFSLEETATSIYEAGSIQWATKRQFPVLDGVSLAVQRIAAGGGREAHWHFNAHELGYCLAGEGEIGIFAPDGGGETFAVGPGSITFTPMGYTHYIRNTGADELHMVIAFNHERPETQNLSAALPGIPTPLMAQNFGLPASGFPFLPSLGERFIVPMPEDASAGTQAATSSSTFSVSVDQLPITQLAGGTVHALTDAQLPRLEGITVFPLETVPYALREAHWHTNAGELNYCLRGRGQIGLIAPDGNIQTMVVGPGSIGFMPKNWLHYIVSLDGEPLEYLIFFVMDDPRVQTIGLAQTFSFFPPEVLAASFGIDPALFATLPNPQGAGIMPPIDME